MRALPKSAGKRHPFDWPQKLNDAFDVWDFIPDVREGRADTCIGI